MLVDSLKALKNLHFHVDVATAQVHNHDVSVDLSEAAEAWSKHRWHAFGADIGKLLQELVLLVFPRKYSLDAAGFLKRELKLVGGGAAQLLGNPGPLGHPGAFAPSLALSASACLSL